MGAIQGLTEERLWKILADLQKKPELKDIFELIYDRLQREGELMTLRGREHRMYLGLFGLSEYPWRGLLRPEHELLIESIIDSHSRGMSTE